MLKSLLFAPKREALDAANALWANLCHQHARTASAAKPAIPFLLKAFQNRCDEIRIEVLDIFIGFATVSPSLDPSEHAAEVRAVLISNRTCFEGHLGSSNELVAGLAKDLLYEF
ncbi:MAG: hypothetical protein AAFV62_13095 [Pseudomonadota bacterium]